MADGQPIRVMVLDAPEAANDAATARKPVLCRETGPCWRWKLGGLDPCEGLCARRAFLDGMPYEVK